VGSSIDTGYVQLISKPDSVLLEDKRDEEGSKGYTETVLLLVSDWMGLMVYYHAVKGGTWSFEGGWLVLLRIYQWNMPPKYCNMGIGT